METLIQPILSGAILCALVWVVGTLIRYGNRLTKVETLLSLIINSHGIDVGKK